MQSDERLTGYLTRENEIGEIVQTSSTFRWDFLLYSALAVGVAYYFIYIRKYKDQYYTWLLNIYLICNAFWIIVSVHLTPIVLLSYLGLSCPSF